MKPKPQPQSAPAPASWQFDGWPEDAPPGALAKFNVDGWIIGLSFSRLRMPDGDLRMHVYVSSSMPSIDDWKFCRFEKTREGGMRGIAIPRGARHTRLFHFFSDELYDESYDAALAGRKVVLQGFLSKAVWLRPDGGAPPFRQFDDSRDCPIGSLLSVQDAGESIPRASFFREGCERVRAWWKYC